MGFGVDFNEIQGLALPKRALEIAAAGGHNVLLVGRPGSGKTMLARRMSGILPDWNEDTRREAVMIWWGAGAVAESRSYNGMEPPTEPPFRAPHHTVSEAGLFGTRVGTSQRAMPGEVSLAHGGVLFLDELPEFHRGLLERLSYTLNTGDVYIAGTAGNCFLQAKFQLIAAMAPCPCGQSGTGNCRCTEGLVERYVARCAPIAQQCAIVVRLPVEPIGSGRASESSADIKARVVAARARRQPVAVTAVATMCERQRVPLARYGHVAEVTATIAALDGTPSVLDRHILEACDWCRL